MPKCMSFGLFLFEILFFLTVENVFPQSPVIPVIFNAVHGDRPSVTAA